jgi:hypothetical protein
VPSYGIFLKETLSNKRKLDECKMVTINQEYCNLIQNKLPPKLRNPDLEVSPKAPDPDKVAFKVPLGEPDTIKPRVKIIQTGRSRSKERKRGIPYDRVRVEFKPGNYLRSKNLVDLWHKNSRRFKVNKVRLKHQREPDPIEMGTTDPPDPKS